MRKIILFLIILFGQCSLAISQIQTVVDTGDYIAQRIEFYEGKSTTDLIKTMNQVGQVSVKITPQTIYIDGKGEMLFELGSALRGQLNGLITLNYPDGTFTKNSVIITPQKQKNFYIFTIKYVFYNEVAVLYCTKKS